MIILSLIPIFIVFVVLMMLIGYGKASKYHREVVDRHNFACDFRERFILFANEYFTSDQTDGKTGQVNNELYIWLIKNVDRIQLDLGHFGMESFKDGPAGFFTRKYPLIAYSLPRFRNGVVEISDVNAVDDCLLKYLGQDEDRIRSLERSLKDPIILTRSGVLIVMSIPLFILSCFDIFSRRTVRRIMENPLYKMLVGIVMLSGLIFGATMIVMHRAEVNEFLNSTMNYLRTKV